VFGLLSLLTSRLAAALGISLGLGLGVGYMAGLALGLTAAPGDLVAAASPRAVLARDQRATFLLILARGLGIGLAVGFAAWLRSGPADGVGLELAAGFAAGLLISATQTVWPSYMLTIGWLASRRCLPNVLAFR
jgi:hypothetical protein